MKPADWRDMRFGSEARESIKKGVDKAANAVKVTLGVTGKTVVIEDPLQQGAPLIIDDGVTVAKSVMLKDPFENLGAELIKQVAMKTDETVGDGTSTSTVLAQAMLNGAFEAMMPKEKGMPRTNEIQPMELKEQMSAAVEKVKVELKKISRVCTPEDIEKVATVSSLDPEVGKYISDIWKEVGNDGVVTLERSQRVGLEKEVTSGQYIHSGWISPWMRNQPMVNKMFLETPVIFITDEKIMFNDDLTPIVNAALQNSYKEIFIVCGDMDGEALRTVLANEQHLVKADGSQGTVSIGVIRAPFFGQEQDEFLEDLAIITDGMVFSKRKGMVWKKEADQKIADIAWFGKAHRVLIDPQSTVIVDGKGDKEKILNRSEEIRQLLKDNPNYDEYDVKRHEKRIANLIGGIGVLKVGASTQAELEAKTHKIEDALNASRAAIKEGIVIGGGSALAKIAYSLLSDENSVGEKVVYESLYSPLKQMAENKGLNSAKILGEIVMEKISFGVDFKTGELCDLFEKGIVDPVKVTRMALENAFSIVSTIISAEAALVGIREEEKK